MPHSGATRFAREEKGGLARDPATIFAHRMPGAADRELLSNAVTLSLEARQSKDAVRVKVTVTNDLTGHHVPTDSPLRHMILVVTGEDGNGRGLDFVSGPTLPDWCGVGEPAEGNYAGLPGKAFAKILEESWTKISPTAAYWNPTRVVSDTRLGAFETDLSEYAFSVPGPEPVRVEARLLYRRAYKDLMALKGWNAPDILMEKETVVLDPPPDGRRSASISASRPPKCP